MPTLLYGCETWTVYQRHARTLNRFHLNCLRKILRIRWQDKIPDTDVLSRSNMMSISIPYWWNINSDGPVMWSEWKTLVFQNSSSLVNCTLGKGHVVLLRNASRILWKLLSNASMLIQRTGNCKLSSVTLGVQPLPTVHLAMRQSASFKQSQKDRKKRQELRMPTQQQLLTPHPVLPA